MTSYFSGFNDHSDLIQAEIATIPGSKPSGRYTFISCPFHNEKTPSARVWHDNGNFQCFGCGTKKRWNELAAVLNLKQVGKDAVKLESQSVPTTNLDRYDSLVDSKSSKPEELKFFELSSTRALSQPGLTRGKWRGFKLDFLASIGVKLCRVVETGRYYLYLPIMIKGKLKGYIKAQIIKPTNKKFPSYINSKGSWSRSSGLFGYDSAVQMMRENGWKTLVLVEGPRDALRLQRFGIPAVCIMGTQSWGPQKLRFLEFSGAMRIILMFDGDAAGKLCTRLIKTGLNKEKEKVSEPLSTIFDVKIVRLWESEVPESFNDSKYDPGNCPLEILTKVKKLVV